MTIQVFHFTMFNIYKLFKKVFHHVIIQSNKETNATNMGHVKPNESNVRAFKTQLSLKCHYSFNIEILFRWNNKRTLYIMSNLIIVYNGNVMDSFY